MVGQKEEAQVIGIPGTVRKTPGLIPLSGDIGGNMGINIAALGLIWSCYANLMGIIILQLKFGEHVNFSNFNYKIRNTPCLWK